MCKVLISIIFLLINLLVISSREHNSSNATDVKILSRKKRYLIFPKGSSFSVATCFTIGIYGNPQYSIFR